MADQNATASASGSTASQTTAATLAADVRDLRDAIDSLDESDVSDMDDVSLVELRDEIKSLEDSVSDTRSDVVDDELQERIDVGDTLLGLSHIESHNKYVAESEISVIMRAVAKGIDYTNFVDVNASTLASDHPELAEVGEAEYTYLR
jgi:hypothetical protein